MEHSIHIFLHLVLFGIWIGSSLALLSLLIRLYRSPLQETPEPTQIQTLSYLQRIPKTTLILMLPMGLQLTSNLGFFTLDGVSMTGIWIFAIFWLAIDWLAAPSRASDTSKAIRMLEFVLQGTFIALLAGTGVLSLLSGTPLAAGWLAAKMIIFALTLVIMTSVDIVLMPLYQHTDSRPEYKKQSLFHAAVLIFVLTLLILMAAWLGFSNYRI